MSRLIHHRAERQLALIGELQAIAKRISVVTLLDGIFPARDAYTEGQCNSCLIVAHQQLETVISIIRDCGEEVSADENPVLPIMERRGQSRGQRGLEAAPAAKAGVVSARKRSGARVVAGGSR